jgi:hypothetical protein
MKTAVELLIEQLPLIQQEGLRFIIEEAKEMFEEQINNAHYEGSENYRRQYYNETFNSEQCK